MSEKSPFHIIEHVVPCQHIRDYPHAVLDDQETVLNLHVKQYIPVDNPDPQPGDVTIIGAHANGFPKELYEPLWEDLLAQAKRHNFRIRSIWIADVAHQGASSVLNEHNLGNDPGWNDHPRDLLHLINTKRSQMPRPIFGIGHSMGGHNLASVALMHPRLFSSLILIDPVIQTHATPKITNPNQPNIARLSTYRRDLWPSRKFAADSFLKSPFYKRWNPRVLDRWIKYGLRSLPTAIHPLDPYAPAHDAVTLTTPKHQEVFTFLRPNYESYGENGKPINRKTHADVNPTQPVLSPFYRGEGIAAYLRLPELRPSVLYIFGGDSDVGLPEACAAKLRYTGIGVGGSGGAPEGRVSSVTYEKIGHLIAMEAVERTAGDSAKWIGKEMERWREDEAEERRTWRTRPRLERQMVDKAWEDAIGGPLVRPDGKGKEKKKDTKL
jgi:pimeloyl-ACP methyl ester carboxylesterase